jgi:GTP-binding protein LepA
MFDPNLIRNFSIIAHIDHGKSTLADRFLEITGAVPREKLVEQYLDRMDLERERGITIKAQAVRIPYKSKSGLTYVLNLIDTPGHVDFTYEVSRALAACEGALLVVDATQGVEAQTVANTHLALENELYIIPVINKVDLPNAEPERVKREIEESLGIETSEALLVSAKTGEGVLEVLEAIVEYIPPPTGRADESLKALIFDSFYDQYKGVVVFVRVFSGVLEAGEKIKMMAKEKEFEVEEVGFLTPDLKPTAELSAGEVGYLIAGIKDVSDTRIGDTITSAMRPSSKPLPGYREPKPMVYSGLYPVEGGEYEKLREALNKLKLNDPSFVFSPESSKALGFGFRCGFLGLLHMDIVKERLEREFGLSLIASAPNVAYQVVTKKGEKYFIKNPSEIPPLGEVEKIEEPYVNAVIITPSEYVGAVMELCTERRGEFINMHYLSPKRVELHYSLPLSEVIFDFFDKLKAKTKGFASFDYELIGYKESDLVKLDIKIAGEIVDALSLIVHRDKAYRRGKELVKKLREIIPRQLFEVPIQAAIGGRVIARETVRALRKDVLAKCYGGDVTRKKKLLEKQKEGKKKMKSLGKVEIPQEAFLEILKV